MNPGDKKTLKLKFPDEYHAKDVAGKDVEFDITVLELKKKVLRFLNQGHIKKLYHRVEKDDKNFGRIFIHFKF